MPLAILLLLIALPFLELYTMVRFAAAAGVGGLLSLLLVSGLAGLLLMRWARFSWTRQIQGGAPSSVSDTPRAAMQSLASAGWLWVGGLLLLLPGLISDVLGLLLVIPLTRHLLRYALLRHVLAGAQVQFKVFGQGFSQAGDDHWRNQSAWNEGPGRSSAGRSAAGTIDAVHWSHGQSPPRRDPPPIGHGRLYDEDDDGQTRRLSRH